MLSVGAYYKAFRGFGGFATAVLTAVPIASELTKGTVSAVLFPPVSAAYKLPTVLVIFALTFAIFACQYFKWTQSADARAKAAWIAFGATVVGFVAYVVCYSRFVRELPAADGPQYVSVGFERKDFSDPHLRDASDDYELLRYRGLKDADIESLWTFPSIVIARLALLLSYLLILLPPVAGCSLIALFKVMGPTTSP